LDEYWVVLVLEEVFLIKTSKISGMLVKVEAPCVCGVVVGKKKARDMDEASPFMCCGVLRQARAD